jgi:hypothetical protein
MLATILKSAQFIFLKTKNLKTKHPEDEPITSQKKFVGNCGKFVQNSQKSTLKSTD